MNGMYGQRSRVVAYARVSTEDQAEKGYSLEGQIEDCCRRAVELGYERSEVLVLTDDVSGAILERPGLSRLRELVLDQAGKPETVIVYDPDRLARKLSLQLLLTDDLTRHGVRLEFVNFEWNNTPEGRMFYQLRGMFAEFEREKIRERTIRGRLTKLKTRGKLSFDPRLYGYRFDTEQDVLVIDTAEAEVVRYIFTAYAGGASSGEIAARLEENGIPAPRGTIWYGATITRILRNQSYTGTYWAYKSDYHKGYRRERARCDQFPLEIEAIVNPELFAEVQEALGRNRTGNGRPPERLTLLSGLAVCACGARMVAGAAAGGREYAYYVCSGLHKPARNQGTGPGKCKTGYWNTDAADNAVWRQVCRFLSEHAPLAVHSAISSAAAAIQTVGEASVADPAAGLLEARLADNERKRQRLIDLYLNGSIDEQRYAERLRRLEEERERTRVRLDELHKARRGQAQRSSENRYTGLLQMISSWTLWGSEDWELKLAGLEMEQRKQLIRMVVDSVEFHPERSLKLRMRLPNFSQNRSDSEGHGGL